MEDVGDEAALLEALLDALVEDGARVHRRLQIRIGRREREPVVDEEQRRVGLSAVRFAVELALVREREGRFLEPVVHAVVPGRTAGVAALGEHEQVAPAVDQLPQGGKWLTGLQGGHPIAQPGRFDCGGRVGRAGEVMDGEHQDVVGVADEEGLDLVESLAELDGTGLAVAVAHIDTALRVGGLWCSGSRHRVLVVLGPPRDCGDVVGEDDRCVLSRDARGGGCPVVSVDVQRAHAGVQLLRDRSDLLREQPARVLRRRHRVVHTGERHLVDPQITQ